MTDKELNDQIIRYLAARDPIRFPVHTGDISAGLGVSKAAVSEALFRLDTKGLVEVASGREKPEKMVLDVTPEGRRYARELKKRLEPWCGAEPARSDE